MSLLLFLTGNLSGMADKAGNRLFFWKLKHFQKLRKYKITAFFRFLIVAVLCFLFTYKLVEEHDNEDTQNKKNSRRDDGCIFGDKLHDSDSR